MLIWVCKDGRSLPVSQMEITHLQNAIAMIQRKPNWRRRFLPHLQAALCERLGLAEMSDTDIGRTETNPSYGMF